MVAFPFFLALIFPFFDTVATFLLEDLNFTFLHQVMILTQISFLDLFIRSFSCVTISP